MKMPFLNRLDVHMQEVVKGSSIAFLIKILGAGLAFSFNVLLARVLGAERAGLYFLALTVTTIATVFGRMGLDNTLLRFTAANAAIGDWVAVKGAYRKGIMLSFLASIISALVMFVAASWLAETVFAKPSLASPMRWMALAVVPMVLLNLHAEMLKGLKRIRDSQLVQGVGVPALSILGFFIFGKVWGVKGAVWAYTLAAMLTALAGYGMWRNTTPQLQNIRAYFKTRELLRSGIPLFWIAIMNLIMNWTATFILGIWGTSSDVGIFGVASRTAMLTSFILVAVNSIAVPKFAALYRQGNLEELGSTARYSAKLMTLLASPLLLMFLLMPGWIMGMFGAYFVKGRVVLSILAVGQFINVATGSVGYLLMMSGNEQLLRNNIIFTALLNICLNTILIYKLGILGAAVATALSLSIMNLISTWLVYRKLAILTLPIPFGVLVHGK